MTPGGFLGLDPEHASFAHARIRMLPVPLEATVSYGAGTARGPAAILAASGQVELYDGEFGGEPALHYGVHTLDAIDGADPEAAEATIAAAVQAAAASASSASGSSWPGVRGRCGGIALERAPRKAPLDARLTPHATGHTPYRRRQRRGPRRPLGRRSVG